MREFMYMVYTKLFLFTIFPYRARKPKHISEFLKKTWRCWQAMAPHTIPLPCALALPPSSHRDATIPSPCWGPSFHDPRPPHVSESHPERAAPLSRRNDERRRAVGSHSAIALRRYLADCSPWPPQVTQCHFWVTRLGPSDDLWANLSQSFHSCWITETWSLNVCVCFYLLLLCLRISDGSQH